MEEKCGGRSHIEQGKDQVIYSPPLSKKRHLIDLLKYFSTRVLDLINVERKPNLFLIGQNHVYLV